MNLDNFHRHFAKETKSEKLENLIVGVLITLFGAGIIFGMETGIINYSGNKTFHYPLLLFIMFMGLVSIYWIRIRYKISVNAHDLSIEELEQRITTIRDKFKMDVLKHEKGYYCFFYKPGFWTPWVEVNVFFDDYDIHMNARPTVKGVVDFGFARRIERKLLKEINKPLTFSSMIVPFSS